MVLGYAVRMLVGVVGLGLVLSVNGCATGKGQEDEEVAVDGEEAAEPGADAVDAKKKGKKGKSAPTAGKKAKKGAKKKKGG